MIKMKLMSMVKVSKSQFCATTMKILLATIPPVTRRIDDFKNTFASAVSCLAKLMLKKRCRPFTIAMPEIVMKITLSDTTVAAVPITSGVVNLDKINQKIYPENIPMISSINKNPVPLPTSILLN